jgi:hypothetical protein
MAAADFAADVYNNIAATGVVLLFAKLVTHRSRTKGTTSWLVFALHVIVVGAAAVAVASALVITAARSEDQPWLAMAWIGLSISGVVLVCDVLLEAWLTILARRS